MNIARYDWNNSHQDLLIGGSTVGTRCMQMR
ncbi:protein of unknown function [Candidatus Nitrosocaldus cavascurensis]|uniref:Uncharacterized protein n=1 Tax=Candidatus Nitrosocaldus cavascurensis TaxID=2058097 RepID=A0A2K5ANV9_9ARCH|nr:protein of unknown function [Candidatus Nitrosocaldus cavascurensis]